ncbi:MAG: ribonuclease M5 [Mycoplasmataceae bacterium]|nr:ribonuclease M5 [Mycoplasmataceae bacterium]
MTREKRIIDGIVVVEGKTDTAKLQKLFEVQTIETGGSRLSKKTIELIKNAAKNNKIILLLDPDGPGESIRRKIEQILPGFYNVHINKKDIKNSKKIGIAEASDSSIIKALSSMVYSTKNEPSFSWEDYLELGIDSKEKRRIICDHFNVSYVNNKQLFKRLNMMKIDIDELKKILDNSQN